VFEVTFANFTRHAVTRVDLENDTRAPLLLIAGGRDRVFRAPVTKSNFRLYRKSKAITAYREFRDRSHYTIGEPGWEQVADYALTWAMDSASAPCGKSGAGRPQPIGGIPDAASSPAGEDRPTNGRNA
jgi:alpha-beta hydrolase superfamily lysophospholipase